MDWLVFYKNSKEFHVFTTFSPIHLHPFDMYKLTKITHLFHRFLMNFRLPHVYSVEDFFFQIYVTIKFRKCDRLFAEIKFIKAHKVNIPYRHAIWNLSDKWGEDNGPSGYNYSPAAGGRLRAAQQFIDPHNNHNWFLHAHDLCMNRWVDYCVRQMVDILTPSIFYPPFIFVSGILKGKISGIIPVFPSSATGHLAQPRTGVRPVGGLFIFIGSRESRSIWVAIDSPTSLQSVLRRE